MTQLQSIPSEVGHVC